MEGRDGRLLADIGYDALPGAAPSLGVHRGDLFLLFAAVRERGIPIELGARVASVEPRSGGVADVLDDAKDHEAAQAGLGGRDLGRFDLVVGADGTRSRVRRSVGLTARDRSYRYGALWAIVPDDGRTADTLDQRMDAAGAGIDAWREQARPPAGPYAPLLDAVTELLPATYRSVSVRSSYRIVAGGAGATVLLGDAAHAMSPQLGAGASLALPTPGRWPPLSTGTPRASPPPWSGTTTSVART